MNFLTYFDITWFSTVDGPGTRVVLFLQGCHLRCPWCHSPHSWQSPSPLLYFENRCLLCGACANACPNKVHSISKGRHYIKRSLCNRCGTCLKSCPVSTGETWNTGALGFAGIQSTVKDLFSLLYPQLELLKKIGGLTVSGGEPLLQFEPLAELFDLCVSCGIHTAVETSASIPTENIASVIDKVDHWLIGLRPARADDGSRKRDSLNEKREDRELVLKNLEFLANRCPANITIRTPIVPGYTDKQECFLKIMDIMAAYKIVTIDLIPYNPFSDSYYRALGIPCPVKGIRPPGQAKLTAISRRFSSGGFKAVIVK